MAVKVLISTKNQRLNFPAVTVNVKLRRLSLNQSATSLLIREYGGESSYAQILLDDAEENKGLCWIKLCDGKSPGSRKLDSSSKSTRTCNITGLIESLNLSNTETTRFEMQLDKQLKAGKIDTNKPLDHEGGETK
jgi:hypothetical protein